jgi:menaquinone-dependent protoporphyrinogen oxidase
MSHCKETTMSSSVLVGYATQYGSTQEVAEAIAETLREGGVTADLRPLQEVRDLSEYSAVVLGAPLMKARFHKDALGFLKKQRQALTERPVAVFALGPVHEPHDEEEWQSSRGQLDKQMAEFPWLSPAAVELFGGVFDPAKLPFPLNKLAGQEPATDARDWTAIRAWAADLKPILEG